MNHVFSLVPVGGVNERPCELNDRSRDWPTSCHCIYATFFELEVSGNFDDYF